MSRKVTIDSARRISSSGDLIDSGRRVSSSSADVSESAKKKSVFERLGHSNPKVVRLFDGFFCLKNFHGVNGDIISYMAF